MSPSTSKPKAKPLRILCFGDSLTEGYSCFGTVMTPYSETLLTELTNKILAGDINRKLEIVTDGMSGDLVTVGGFRDRMTKNYATNNPKYDYTLFLGGTNDLAYRQPASKIFAAIEDITSIPLAHNSKVVLFTVPECGVKSETLDRNRDELNQLIRQDGGEGGREGVFLFDLNREIVYWGMEEAERELIWDDGLHFTEKGYERMGELVAGRLVEIIEEDEAKMEKV